ncbi:MAG: hypothetical protein IPO91_20585 [Chloroflexi bacterium]|nr:hypothetical protein [Chloroflexota bacterium]
MTRDHEWEAQIERKVKRRWQRRMLLLADFTLFIIYCAWLGGSWNIDPFFRQVGMVWLVAVGCHTLWLIYTEWLDFAVRRALQQERKADPYVEKPKREDSLVFSDDDDSADAVEFDERAYRQRR